MTGSGNGPSFSDHETRISVRNTYIRIHTVYNRKTCGTWWLLVLGRVGSSSVYRYGCVVLHNNQYGLVSKWEETICHFHPIMCYERRAERIQFWWTLDTNMRHAEQIYYGMCEISCALDRKIHNKCWSQRRMINWFCSVFVFQRWARYGYFIL